MPGSLEGHEVACLQPPFRPMIALCRNETDNTVCVEYPYQFYVSDVLIFQAQKEYMGLAIKNDNLVYVYNLGNEDVEIPLDSKPVSSWPAYFSIVKIER